MIQFLDVIQGTEEWLDVKLSRFSASNIHRLMGVRGLCQTGLSYIDELICEVLTGQQQHVSTYAMQRGIELEPFARNHFSEGIGKVIKTVGCVVNSKYENTIVSPDGIFYNEKIGVEIKCPEKHVNHKKYLRLFTNNDLKKVAFNYYCQIQLSLMVTEYDKWYFVSYHPEFNNYKGVDCRLYALPIYPDYDFFKKMAERIKEAYEILKNELKQIINTFKN